MNSQIAPKAYLSNVFASYILQSLPVRYMRGKSKLMISTLQVRGAKYTQRFTVWDFHGPLSIIELAILPGSFNLTLASLHLYIQSWENDIGHNR